MEYTLQFHPRVETQISQWGLSANLLMALYIHFQDFRDNPMPHLRPDPDGQGHLFPFQLGDPDFPAWRHLFHFRVYVDQAAGLLSVVRGSYWREVHS